MVVNAISTATTTPMVNVIAIDEARGVARKAIPDDAQILTTGDTYDDEATYYPIADGVPCPSGVYVASSALVMLEPVKKP